MSRIEEVKKINNFEEFGFTADFEGEILKKIDDTDYEKELYLGYFISKFFGEIISATWDKEGYCFQDKSMGRYGYNLTPIKKEWYEENKIIEQLDSIFKYKLNEEVEAEIFDGVIKKGSILMRMYQDYNKHNETQVWLRYKINFGSSIVEVEESKIIESKNDKNLNN